MEKVCILARVSLSTSSTSSTDTAGAACREEGGAARTEDVLHLHGVLTKEQIATLFLDSFFR